MIYLIQQARIANEILMYFRSLKKLGNEVFMQDPIGVDKDGNEISLAEVLGTEPDEVQRDVELILDSEQLWAAMDNALNERERTVVQLRYGLAGGRCMPQREIAGLLGISRSYISRLEKKAIMKLNNEFEKLGVK